LKEVAPSNMYCSSITLPVFHLLRSPLKEVAPSNMLSMSITLPVLHSLRSPLNMKAVAP
jgi:hypothetical protein